MQTHILTLAARQTSHGCFICLRRKPRGDEVCEIQCSQQTFNSDTSIQSYRRFRQRAYSPAGRTCGKHRSFSRYEGLTRHKRAVPRSAKPLRSWQRRGCWWVLKCAGSVCIHDRSFTRSGNLQRHNGASHRAVSPNLGSRNYRSPGNYVIGCCCGFARVCDLTRHMGVVHPQTAQVSSTSYLRRRPLTTPGFPQNTYSPLKPWSKLEEHAPKAKVSFILKPALFRRAVLVICLHPTHTAAAPRIRHPPTEYFPQDSGLRNRSDYGNGVSSFYDTRRQYDTSVVSWTLTPIVFATIVAIGFLIERKYSAVWRIIPHTIRDNLGDFWTITTFVLAAALGALCDQNTFEGPANAIIIACLFNQYRACFREVVAIQTALPMTVFSWLTGQHFLVKLVSENDRGLQRVVVWLTACVCITGVSRLCALVLRGRVPAHGRIYHNVHVWGGAPAVVGDVINVQQSLL